MEFLSTNPASEIVDHLINRLQNILLPAISNMNSIEEECCGEIYHIYKLIMNKGHVNILPSFNNIPEDDCIYRMLRHVMDNLSESITDVGMKRELKKIENNFLVVMRHLEKTWKITGVPSQSDCINYIQDSGGIRHLVSTYARMKEKEKETNVSFREVIPNQKENRTAMKKSAIADIQETISSWENIDTTQLEDGIYIALKGKLVRVPIKSDDFLRMSIIVSSIAVNIT